MQNLEYAVPFLAYTVVYLIPVWLLLGKSRISGKGWLIAFLAVQVAIQGLTWMSGVFVAGNDRAYDNMSSFQRALLPLRLAGPVLLVAFVLTGWPEVNIAGGPRSLLFSFQGRLKRQPFWIVWIVFLVVNVLLLTAISEWSTSSLRPTGAWKYAPFPAVALWFVFNTWVYLSLWVKRFHDRDKSGWWILIGLVPVVGPVWLLVEGLLFRGTDGPNRFDSAFPTEPANSAMEPSAPQLS